MKTILFLLDDGQFIELLHQLFISQKEKVNESRIEFYDFYLYLNTFSFEGGIVSLFTLTNHITVSISVEYKASGTTVRFFDKEFYTGSKMFEEASKAPGTVVA